MPWVVFEGIDGVGKTTQARALASYLRHRRLPVLYRHVFDTAVGRAQRHLFMKGADLGPTLEILLLAAARASYMREFVQNPRYAGHFILTDRFFHSILSMQGLEPGVDPQFIPGLAEVVLAGRRPDLTLLLDAGPATCRERLRHSQSLDRIKGRSLDFHARVRAAFLQLARDDPGVVVVGAEDGFWEVQAQIRQVIGRRFPAKAGMALGRAV